MFIHLKMNKQTDPRAVNWHEDWTQLMAANDKVFVAHFWEASRVC